MQKHPVCLSWNAAVYRNFTGAVNSKVIIFIVLFPDVKLEKSKQINEFSKISYKNTKEINSKTDKIGHVFNRA